jgi:hypothetical protein
MHRRIICPYFNTIPPQILPSQGEDYGFDSRPGYQFPRAAIYPHRQNRFPGQLAVAATSDNGVPNSRSQRLS